LKSRIKMDLERSASAMRIAEGALELARQEFAAARENLAVQESLQEKGRSEPKDIEAARDLLAAREIGVIEAEDALFQQQVELLRVCGLLAGLFSTPA
jgi:outer membrane protein TolC